MSSRVASLMQNKGQPAVSSLGKRTLVFVGLMGAGKSVIGKMSAAAMNVPFVDSDQEIEKVSRMSIADLFESYGETEFRALEERVIRRLLKGGPMILSTGGGAFIHDRTRSVIKRRGLSVWLRADLEVLWERVRKRGHRPLLKTENPKETLSSLLEARYPIYAEADIVVQSRDVHKETIVGEVLDAVIKARPEAGTGQIEGPINDR
jgi:shikimate kinase